MADQETMPTRITFSKRLSDIQTANPSMGIDEAFALAMSDDPSTAPNLGASASTNAFSAVVKTKSDAQYACAVAALRNLPAKPGAPKPTYPDALARVANSVPAMSVQQATEVLQRALKADEAAAAAHMATVSSSTAHTMKTMTDSGSLNTAYQAGIEAAKR